MSGPPPPRRRLPAAALLAALLLAAAPVPAVDMVLRKSLMDEYQAPPEAVSSRVLPGDTLDILLRRAGHHAGATPALVEEVLRLNPTLANPHRILAGTVLRLPAPGADPAGPGRPPRTDGGRFPTLPPPGPPQGSRDVGPSHLVREAFGALGERVKESGTLYLPLEQGSLELDGVRYPTVTLGTGVVLILDGDGTLDEATRLLVEETWPTYRVVGGGEGRSPQEVLDEALSRSGYYSLARRKRLVLGGENSLTLKCDWLVEKDADSIITGTLYALNQTRAPREYIPGPIRDYARRYGIEVVNVAGSSPAGEPEAPPSPEVSDLSAAASPAVLAGRILLRLGIPARENSQVTLSPPGREGIVLTLQARWVVGEGSGRVLLVDRPLPPRLQDAVRAAGIPLVQLAPESPPESVLTSLLAALSLRYIGPGVEFYQPGGTGEDKFVLTLAGFFTRHRGENLLFTRKRPEETLLSFLGSRGIRVVTY